MYELLRSFTAVLDEFGVSHGRAKKAALCAAEGMMMVDNQTISCQMVTKWTIVLGWSTHKRKPWFKCL